MRTQVAQYFYDLNKHLLALTEQVANLAQLIEADPERINVHPPVITEAVMKIQEDLQLMQYDIKKGVWKV